MESSVDWDIVRVVVQALIGILLLWGISALRKTISVVDKLSFLVLGIDGRNGMRSRLHKVEERVDSATKRLDQHDNTLARYGERIETLEETGT